MELTRSLRTARGSWVASGVTLLLGIAVAAPTTDCFSSPPAPSTSCGVYSGSPCVPGTLYPPSGVGCYGTVCPSGDVCGGTGQPQFPTEMFSCAPGPLACGNEVFGGDCTSDSDCAGMATCSAGVCYGTACPSGQQCSSLSLVATCQPADGGAGDATPSTDGAIATDAPAD
jgi:hypothetical protein